MLAQRDDDDSSAVTFHSNFTAAGFKLMELSKELEEVVSSGTSQICFKAGQGESAVFCTEDKTYNVRVADTSNTLYLSIPEVATEKGKHQGMEVQGVVKEYFELEEIPPRTEQLTDLLFQAPYAGALTEPDVDSTLKKTFEQINEEVQASPSEIRRALEALNAFEFEGCWRVLAEGYRAEIFRVILLSAVTEELSLERLSLRAVMKTIAEHDVTEFVAKAILETYGTLITNDDTGGGAAAAAAVSDGGGASAAAVVVGGGVGAEDGPVYRLSVEAICRFEALELLKLQERWPSDSFYESWSEAVPEGMMIKPEHLDGLALASDGGTSGGGKELSYYPEAVLPNNIKKRMAALFEKQKAWSMQSIRPYLTNLAIAPLTVEKILFKHARAYTDSSTGTKVKMYNKR